MTSGQVAQQIIGTDLPAGLDRKQFASFDPEDSHVADVLARQVPCRRMSLDVTTARQRTDSTCRVISASYIVQIARQGP